MIPLAHEVQAAFLHPSIEVCCGDCVGVVEDWILRRENLDRRFFYRDARAAQVSRIRSELAAVEFAYARVVLHDERTAGGNEIEELFVIGGNVFLRVIGADAEGDRSELAEIGACQLLSWNQGDVHSDLLQDRRDVVPRAHDVAYLQIMRDFDIDDADALPSRLVIVDAAKIISRDERVPFAVFAAFGIENRADREALLLEFGREYFERKILFLSAMLE